MVINTPNIYLGLKFDKNLPNLNQNIKIYLV